MKCVAALFESNNIRTVVMFNILHRAVNVSVLNENDTQYHKCHNSLVCWMHIYNHTESSQESRIIEYNKLVSS